MLDNLIHLPTLLAQAEPAAEAITTAADEPSVTRLILVSVAGIAILLWLIINRKVHAFVALLLVSILIGVGTGLTGTEVIDAVTKGMGNTLGFVAIVVGLGAMFGQLLEVSGGAQSLAAGLLKGFGEKRSPWALGLAGFLISIPAFFDVGFVIVAPILYGLSKKSGKPLMYFAMPLMGGMATTHAFIPPTPGPIGVAGLLNADLGLVILFGFIAGIPAMALSGPLYGKFIANKVPARIPESMEINEDAEEAHSGKKLPSFTLVASLILLPLLLILMQSVTNAAWSAEAATASNLMWLRETILLIGHPFVALLLTALLCFRVLGTAQGFTREEVQEIATKALEPAGIIILVTGAGGVLKQILVDSQVGELIATGITNTGLPLIVVAFLIAVIIRFMQGSATVAMLTTAGLLAGMLEGLALPLTPQLTALLVIPIASGATICSHVNDSGFWMVNRYLGMTVPETLKTWTVCTTIIAFVGLIMALIISMFIPHTLDPATATQTAALLTP